MTIVRLDTRRITGWDTPHDAFADAFGFPAFYGRNMDAWIDCMTYLDEAGAGMSTVHAPAGGVLVLQLEHVDDFAARCPEQFSAIVECSAFVNWRRLQQGQTAALALSFYKSA